MIDKNRNRKIALLKEQLSSLKLGIELLEAKIREEETQLNPESQPQHKKVNTETIRRPCESCEFQVCTFPKRDKFRHSHGMPTTGLLSCEKNQRQIDPAPCKYYKTRTTKNYRCFYV